MSDIDCLFCSPNLIKAAERGIHFCNEQCRIRFEALEHV